jgi:hypothetical protein
MEGEKRVERENREVNDISTEVIQTTGRDGTLHSDAMSEPKGEKRTTIPVVEEVAVVGPKGTFRVLARIDTGAARTTLDTDLAARAGLGPVLDRVRIRASAASAPEERDVVHAKLIIAGREFAVPVAVTDRKDMRYHMIVGMDVLRDSGFLVDPSRGDGRENDVDPHVRVTRKGRKAATDRLS